MPDYRRGIRKSLDGKGVRIGSRGDRIRIPQPTRRPLKILERQTVRTSLLKEDPSWFVLHRRGVRRPWVGIEPLELRAVSRSSVRGYLHERICYKWFTGVAHFRPGSDFDFQSSLEGGRMELGGMVVDFLFPYLRIAFNVLGPTHEEQARKAKDREQADILREMGYQPMSVTTALVEDEYMFNKVMMGFFLALDRTQTPLFDIVNYPREEDENMDIVYENIEDVFSIDISAEGF